MIEQRVCIVGLGLMGGSLAQALAGQARWLAGVEAHAATRQRALADGIFDLVTDDLAEGLRTADFVILATPVHAILNILTDLPQVKPEGCLVLDLGSTKEAICTAMSELPQSFGALGGHPMCGKETAGYSAGTPALFAGQTFVLCRTERSTPAVEAAAAALVAQIGAQPLFLDAQRHDDLVAAVSHLPYVLSAVLMQRAAQKGDERLWQVSASGFRDSSRLAGSDPRMMRDILQTNKTAVLAALAAYQQDLAQFTALLQADDDLALAQWLSAAQRAHAQYRKEKEGRGKTEPG